MEIQLYSIAYPVTSLGPGRRVVVWLAGCKKRCKGCISPEMQDFKAGRRIAVAKLLRKISKLSEMVEGITISGGEPFEQLDALDELLNGLTRQMPQWNVIVYTGYTLSTLVADSDKSINILNKIDVLIDGPYRMETPTDHPLKGSGNQRIHYLTKKGQSVKKQLDNMRITKINLGIGNDMQVLIGIVGQEERCGIHRALGIKKSTAITT